MKPMSWSRSDFAKNGIFVKIGCTSTHENSLFLKMFENQSSGRLQNEEFPACSLNYFTTVEAYFENQCSESTRVTDVQFSQWKISQWSKNVFVKSKLWNAPESRSERGEQLSEDPRDQTIWYKMVHILKSCWHGFWSVSELWFYENILRPLWKFSLRKLKIRHSGAFRTLIFKICFNHGEIIQWASWKSFIYGACQSFDFQKCSKIYYFPEC